MPLDPTQRIGENAMSRSQIDRLTRRIEALQAQRKPPEQRIFTVLVRNHMRTDEEIARFCAEHGVTDSDLLIAQILVPFETRPGETAKDAYELEGASRHSRGADLSPKRIIRMDEPSTSAGDLVKT
jgi:hypothetical protein